MTHAKNFGKVFFDDCSDDNRIGEDYSEFYENDDEPYLWQEEIDESWKIHYVTEPNAYESGKPLYHYFVQLLSKEKNWEGIPIDEKIVDCVITEPTIDAIAALLTDVEILEDWKIIRCWRPDEDCPF